MGWDISERGFKIVLSADGARPGRAPPARDVDAFLAEHGLDPRATSRTWVCPPGRPQGAGGVRGALELDARALELTWASLREVGNLSSASVLLVLGDTLRDRRRQPGATGLLLAMGPGSARSWCCSSGERAAWLPRTACSSWSRWSAWSAWSSWRCRRAQRAAGCCARGGREVGARRTIPYGRAARRRSWSACVARGRGCCSRPFVPALGLGDRCAAGSRRPGAALLVLRTLGDRWNTRVIVVPGAAAGHRRPVPLAAPPELPGRAWSRSLALPLVHSAWLTAIVFTVLNAILLALRIPAEERAGLAQAHRA